MASIHGMHRLGTDRGESGGRGGLGCGSWIHWPVWEFLSGLDVVWSVSLITVLYEGF